MQPLEDLNSLLNLADVHLLPQRADAADLVMPSKLTGMLASGRPVVATALEGTQIFSVVSKCGLVVEPGNPRAFADAVESLLDNDDVRTALGGEARQLAESELGIEPILKAFESELVDLQG